MPTSCKDRILRILSYIHDNPSAQAMRRIRLHRAAIMLVQSQLPIDRIAADCGYPNSVSFVLTHKGPYSGMVATYKMLFGGW